MICTSKEKWELMLDELFEQTHFRLPTQKLVGLHIIGFVRKQLNKYMGSLDTFYVKTGYCGMLGNKGAVGRL